MATKDDLGRLGEQLAVEHVLDRGFEVLDRNWRCRWGELDIVALDRGQVVVIEVKTRSGLGYGHPFEAITHRKLARLRRLAGAWREAHADVGGALRLDAIAVVAPRDAAPTVMRLEGIG
jgi:putative endonuclease